MGGKASKDPGLVPRDGTDEIEIPPKKLVSQEQFDELRHKFQLLEQLMQQDKGKLSDLETSVTEYHQDKQLLRKSFVEIDSEVRRDKEGREQLEKNLAQLVEERTREKYQLLDQMLNSQEERLKKLMREQSERADKLQQEYGQLDQKLTTSLKVERSEYERLLESKMNEDKGQGQLEMTVSRLVDQKVSPLPNLQQELEARKRETEEVRESIQRDKDELLAQIQKVQASLENSKQSAAAEGKSELEEQLSNTKDEMVSRLKEEQLARGELEKVMRTMLDNKVNEQQKALFERIKEKEDKIQSEIERMEQLKQTMEEMKEGQKEVEKKFSEASIVYEQRLAEKEDEKRELTRKISQNFESRLSEMQSSLTHEMSKVESIKEESQGKDEVLEQLQDVKAKVEQKLQVLQDSIETITEEKIQSLRAQLTSEFGQSADGLVKCENELTAVRSELSTVDAKVSAVRTEFQEEWAKFSDELDAKIDVQVEARTEYLPELTNRMGRAEARCEDLEQKLGGASTGQLDSDQLEQIQKTEENVSVLLDRMESSRSDFESVSHRLSEMDRRQGETESHQDTREGQLIAIHSELEQIRTENKELRARLEAPSSELTKLSEENARLRESVDSLMRSRDDQTATIEFHKQQSGEIPDQPDVDIPPPSPLEKIEEMELVIKKQGHGMNDLEFLVDEVKELSRTTIDKVDGAIDEFGEKFAENSDKMAKEFNTLRDELMKKLQENSANQKTAPPQEGATNQNHNHNPNPFEDNFS